MLARSASPPKSAALEPGLFREAGHRAGPCGRLRRAFGTCPPKLRFYGAFAYPGERRCRGRIRRVFTRRMAWRNTACAPCTQIRLSAAAPLLPTWDASCPASRKRAATKAGRWCACGQDSSRTIPTNNGYVTARDVPANRTTPALCAKPSTRRGTRRQGWTRETCAGASGFACRGRRRYSAKPSCA